MRPDGAHFSGIEQYDSIGAFCGADFCVIIKIVQLYFAIASSSFASVCKSKALVQSSNSKIFGFRIKARAMEMRCCCPPDSVMPF